MKTDLSEFSPCSLLSLTLGSLPCEPFWAPLPHMADALPRVRADFVGVKGDIWRPILPRDPSDSTGNVPLVCSGIIRPLFSFLSWHFRSGHPLSESSPFQPMGKAVSSGKRLISIPARTSSTREVAGAQYSSQIQMNMALELPTLHLSAPLQTVSVMNC